MLCSKNLHEIDGSFRPPPSTPVKCKECYREKCRRAQATYRLKGREAEISRAYRARGLNTAHCERWRAKNMNRVRAYSLARKYGLSLRQIKEIGLDFYPDIREALNGNH